MLSKEEKFKYNSPSTHLKFFKSVKQHKSLLQDLLSNLIDMKKKVIGYGASTKGNVILQYCNLNSNNIRFIVDVNKDKNNKFTPGSLIKLPAKKKLKIINQIICLFYLGILKILFFKKKKII